MLVYNTSTGEIRLDGEFEGYGYSGHGEGRNNPAMEAVPNVGPIPRGKYRIGPARNDPQKGPICFRLFPVGHDAHNRSGFMIHGDNVRQDASEGCIIAGRLIRRAIDNDAETELEAV